MKNNSGDEKLDAMLSELFSSEVPEDMQFHMNEADEIRVSVKKSERKITGRIIKTAVACAAAFCIAFPLWYMNSRTGEESTDKNTDSFSDSADPDLLNEFTESSEKYGYDIIPLESSRFYREFSENPFSENTDSPMSAKFNTLSTGLLLYLNLVPYEEYETEGKTLYVRVIDNGNRRIFTQEAYLVSRDKEGRINGIVKTSESISEDEEIILSSANIFKGAENAQAGAENIVSKFLRRNSEVRIDGHLVREAVGAETNQSTETSSACACIRINGELVPFRMTEFCCTVDKKTQKNDDIPEFIKTVRKGEETKFYTVLAYNCTMSNSFRTEIKENTLW